MPAISNIKSYSTRKLKVKNMEFMMEIIITFALSLVMMLLTVPKFKTFAVRIGLVDKPNHRKVHKNAVPLVGGLAIAFTASLALILNNTFLDNIRQNIYMISSALLLLLVGALDDRVQIKPLYRLTIQTACAYTLAATGSRITSLYGLFGIEEIPLIIQYILTVVVVVGVVNAFNLMDGIDGLAGSLALTGLFAFAILTYIHGERHQTMIFVALCGSIVGFLRFNLSKKKIFMGDGGSMFLGFILVASGIRIIEISQYNSTLDPAYTLLIVISVFLIPVLDSVRVYAGRIKQGKSPFMADKSHLHHLLLLIGLNHNYSVVAIILSSLGIGLAILTMTRYFTLTAVLFFGWLIFKILTKFLYAGKTLKDWKEQLNRMESGEGATYAQRKQGD
ncbi:MAG: undecaprenyl/decaprenyl-phosphate alpha-N-acetylglucosaminyl 1-phosphate transferase [Cytophagales bacterium]|nr:undecaprenyl/decaprenyl-phosphate alpha-N-acetylglucosaminyl 1-phosphate transferase [Cytophagales bacterium]